MYNPGDALRLILEATVVIWTLYALLLKKKKFVWEFGNSKYVRTPPKLATILILTLLSLTCSLWEYSLSGWSPPTLFFVIISVCWALGIVVLLEKRDDD